MSEPDKAAFTPHDLMVIRWLALALGVITCVECLLAKSTTMLLLVIGVNLAAMVLGPLTVYLVRRTRAK